MRLKHRPLSNKEMMQLIRNGQLISGEEYNQRQANCKACGTTLQKGAGQKWLKFGPNNRWHFQIIYLCLECDIKYSNLLILKRG